MYENPGGSWPPSAGRGPMKLSEIILQFTVISKDL